MTDSSGGRPRQDSQNSLPPPEVVRENITAALQKLHGPERRGGVLSAAAGGRGLVLSAVAESHPVPEADHAALAADLLQRAREALDAQPPDPITVGGFNDNDN